MSDVPLALTCPFCTGESTCIVANRVRAFGPGWLLVRVKCDDTGCGRRWYARLTLVGVSLVRDDDPEIHPAGAAASIESGGLACPRCQGRNVQIPTDVGYTVHAGDHYTLAGASLCRTCLDCQVEYLSRFMLTEVLKAGDPFAPVHG